MALRKRIGFNQDFEFRCLGGKYQDLFFQSGFRDTADFFSDKTNSKLENIRIPCLPILPNFDPFTPSRLDTGQYF